MQMFQLQLVQVQSQPVQTLFVKNLAASDDGDMDDLQLVAEMAPFENYMVVDTADRGELVAYNHMEEDNTDEEADDDIGQEEEEASLDGYNVVAFVASPYWVCSHLIH